MVECDKYLIFFCIYSNSSLLRNRKVPVEKVQRSTAADFYLPIVYIDSANLEEEEK